ncbi:MAG TPA: Gfo/Idh/MocA family oxidoreductase [Saprospiraceae bacterium]|nr:Gfo/Idh/MocA family oxidoreductase [Saprospiraceae bacterium]HMQ83750.1 Gfo/Idh/MocA family oxidoreductase [Saprospiraceae bacterium]
MTKPNGKIKFAVAGCGYIGKKHAALIQDHPECDLVALMDVKPKDSLGIEAFSLPFFDDLPSMLAQMPEIDVLCICTPNACHAQQAMVALDYKKHVVIEKPMGLSKAECEQVLHKALNQSRQVFCVMQNRYSPPAAWLKKMVEEKRLGQIRLVQLNCFWNRDDRYYFKDGQRHEWHGRKALDGGTLYTQFAHFIDIMYWVFGDIKKIKARFDNFEHQHSTDFEDTGLVMFDFVNGGKGCLQFSTAVWDKNFESTITILGSKGSIKLGGQYMNRLEYCHIDNYEAPVLEESLPANQYAGYQGSAANHHYVFDNVVEVLKERTQPTTNALEGMKVVDIIERIYRAGQ